MITFKKHETATCPDCGASLVYGTKEEASSWKVYYECNERCGWEQMTGRVSMADVGHRDDVDDRAREMGDQWAGP